MIGKHLSLLAAFFSLDVFHTEAKVFALPGVTMPFMRAPRTFASFLVAFVFVLFSSPRCCAQAALLMEEPYGFFGTVNPTGHTAIYFANICAETPTRLRRCEPGDMGSVIARYSGFYYLEWQKISLLPLPLSVGE